MKLSEQTKQELLASCSEEELQNALSRLDVKTPLFKAAGVTVTRSDCKGFFRLYYEEPSHCSGYVILNRNNTRSLIEALQTTV